MIDVKNFEETLLMYEAVEKAVETNSELMCPAKIGQWNVDVWGDVGVVLPGLYWVDELRNVYQAKCSVKWSLGRHRLYVDGAISLDGWSGDLSIIKQENRYLHVRVDDSKWDVFETGGMCPKCQHFEVGILRNYCPQCGKRLFKE